MLVPNSKTRAWTLALGMEAIVVGVVLSILLVVTTSVVPLHQENIARTSIVGFVLGVVTHLGFELVGANAWYCRQGAACFRESQPA